MENRTICASCGGWNSGDNNNEKEKQRQVKEFGVYIHDSCIERLVNVDPNRIITNTGFYSYGSPKVCGKNYRGFQGFAGAKITVVYKDKIEETNNLFFSDGTNSKRAFEIVKNKINAILVWKWNLTEEEIQKARKSMFEMREQ